MAELTGQLGYGQIVGVGPFGYSGFVGVDPMSGRATMNFQGVFFGLRAE